MTRSLVKKIALIEYLIIATTGVLLISFKIVDDSYKISVLTITFGVSVIPVSFRLYKKKWSKKSIGFTFNFNNFKETFPKYLAATLIGISALVVYSAFFNTYSSISNTTLVYYSIWGAIAQELLYRAYLYKLGQDIFGEESHLNDTLNVVVFVGMHCLYPGFLEKLWILIPAGFLFTFLWKKYPNIIWICIAHIILNATAVSLGIFH